MSRLSRFTAIAIAVVVLLLVVRLMLPYAVRHYVNGKLQEMGEYSGHIDSVGIKLWRGAYTLEGMEIRKRSAPVDDPMFQCPKVEIAVSWDALMQHTVAAKLKAYRPRINFAAGADGKGAQTGAGQDWRDVISRLVPTRIERLDVIDGEVHYLDRGRSPAIDLHFTHFNGSLTNLTNIRGKDGERVAELDATATAMDESPFDMQLKLDPFDRKPNFDLRMRLLGLDVNKMKTTMRAYLPFDADSGTLDLVIEANGKNDHFKGDVKPIFHHLTLLSWKQDVADKAENPLKLAVKAAGSVLNLAFQNQAKDQLAADVPVEGKLDEPSIQILATLGSVLENAFVKALDPSYQHSAEGHPAAPDKAR